MIAGDLHEMLHTVPFRPFTIRMDDGKGYHVRHRDLVMPAPDGWAVMIVNDLGTFTILPTRKMASIEVFSS